MSNVDVPQDNDPANDEIESPVDGPTPDWMKVVTSASSTPSLTEENTPDWLKDIQSGKTNDEPEQAAKSADEDDPFAGMSDLERLLAEEGVDLGAVEEDRPEGSEGMSAREWMITTSDDEMIRNRVGAEAMEGGFSVDEPEEDPYAGMSDLERLLAEEGVELDTVAEDRPEGSEGMSAREWMITTSDDEMIRNRIGAEAVEEEAPPAPVPAAAPEPAESKDTPDEDLPDWLQDIDDEEEDEPEPSFAEMEDDGMVVSDDLPDWLQTDEAEDDDDDDDALPDSGDLPDWLADIEEDDETPAAPIVSTEGEDDKMVVEDDLPDWLQDIEEDLTPTPEPEPAIDEAGSAPAGDDDLPDWLRDVEEDATAPLQPVDAVDETADEDDKMVIADDLPDWLQEVAEEESAPPEPVTAAAADEDDGMVVDEDLPDWLQEAVEDEALDRVLDWEDASEEEEPPSPITGEADTEDDLGLGDDEDLPDWLQEAQEAADDEPLFDENLADDDDDLPDWLSEAQAADDEPFEPSEPDVEEFDEIFDDDEEDLPDWLKEVQDEEDETPVPEVVAEAVAPAPAEKDIVEEDELPDWLAEVEPESVSEVLEIAEAPAPVAAVVDAEPEPAAAEPVPVEAEEVIEEQPPEEAEEIVEDAEEIEAPAEEIEPLPATPAPVPLPASTGGMPDWLKKLREGNQEEAVAVPQPQPVAQIQVVAQPRPELPSPEAQDADLPADPDERLNLARTARDDGNIEEASRVYTSLVASGAHLDTIIDDMELTIRSYPSNYLLYQVMGDAMMKDGRLQSALETYRTALEKLSG